MTLQSSAPLADRAMHVTHRPADWFVSLAARSTEDGDVRTGGLELDAPYQRGQVWTPDQQRLLLKSFLLGVPVPAVVVNDRLGARFRHDDGGADWRYTVVDGRQRVSAMLAWFAGRLDIPASWLDSSLLTGTHDSDDGPYVRVDELTLTGQRRVANRMTVAVAEGHLRSMRAEAELYLLLNRGGVEHTDEDLLAARTLTR